MGATGHVGAVVADQLLTHGHDVTILTRKPDDEGAWAEKGAVVAKADAEDAASLKEAFRRGTRAFLLNPPADPTGDTDATERRTIANILAALEASNLEKVVAASTYGAQPGQSVGDLSTLWTLEEGLRSQSIPSAINRGAYYMTNWLGYTEVVRRTGVLPSMFPAEMKMPMVAPVDVGAAAAERLMAPTNDTGVQYVEGPTRYTPWDVASAFAAALDREVTLEAAPRDTWETIFKDAGFSPQAASAYARMTAVSLDSGFDTPPSPRRGAIDLEAFIAEAVNAS